MGKKASIPPGIAVAFLALLIASCSPASHGLVPVPTAHAYCGAKLDAANRDLSDYRFFAHRKRRCYAGAGGAPGGCRLRAGHVAPTSPNRDQRATHDGRFERHIFIRPSALARAVRASHPQGRAAD